MSERSKRQPQPVEAEAETEVGQPEVGEGGPQRESAFLPEPAQPEEARPHRPRAGNVTLIYTGDADVLRHGEHTFRPGEPVTVPSEVAEELLTLPFESFIDAHEAQKAKE